MTKYTRPSRSSTLKIGTMLGWFSCCRRTWRFAQKAGSDVRAKRQVRWQQLDRDPTLEPRVARAVHDRHAAAAKLLIELIRRCERLRQSRRELRVGLGRWLLGHAISKFDGRQVVGITRKVR